MAEQLGEDPAREKLLRVRRHRPRGPERKLRQPGNALDALAIGAQREHGGEPLAARHAEKRVLARAPQVRVDEQGALAGLRERDRKVRGETAAAFAAACADDGERAFLRAIVEPAT